MNGKYHGDRKVLWIGKLGNGKCAGDLRSNIELLSGKLAGENDLRPYRSREYIPMIIEWEKEHLE
jgi:hypothetical protein